MTAAAAGAARGWAPPAEFEEYRLVRLLGRGAMGEVYLAHDLLLDRPVAVKFVAGVEPTPHARERFYAEARALARLQHPNVVAVYRAGEVRGRPYLVSEYLRGQSLDRLALPLPWERAVGVALALARGLAAAHRTRVLHRDLKPSNAMLTEAGEAKLVDFGLAQRVDAPEAAAPAAPAEVAAPPTPGAAGDETLPLPAGPERAHAPAPAAAAPPPGPAPGRAPVGTPLYMAPELWRGEAATPASDVYAFGALLFELCAGRAPFHGTAVAALPARTAAEDAPPLAEAAPGVPPPLAALVDACLRRDPAARPRSGERLRELLEDLSGELLAAPGAEGAPDGNPYRGLQVYEAEHRGVFFGRAREARAVLERLRGEPLVLVAGDSGVGKSSLCRAGVLPAVAAGALGGEAAWEVARVVPGRRPVAAVAAALAGPLGLPEARVAALLEADPAALARALRRAPHATLLFLDQLEELWTLAVPEEAARVRELVAALSVRSARVRVLGTLRSDFLTRLAADSGLGEELTSALYLLRPLGPEGLREAIAGPARARGYTFDPPALVDALVAATARSAAGLPLMQFALAELWEARDAGARAIHAAALERLGGVEAALARHADDVLAGLPARERAAAQAILTALVTAEGTRARRTGAELAPDAPARAALQALLRGRLLVAREAADAREDGSSYEIAHDALLTGWDTLRGWLGRDAEKRALEQRVERAAAEWERLGRGAEGLWTARQLHELRRAHAARLGPRERAFVDASGRRERRRRLVRGAALLALPLLLGAGLLGAQVRARILRDRAVDAQLAAARTALAEARAREPQLARLRAEAFAHFDRGEREEGERAWAAARAVADAVEAGHLRASSALEAALVLAPGRADLRAPFAEVTAARALAAGRDHRPAERAQLLARLAAYDAGGVQRARLEAPATLSVTTRPSGARVRLLRSDAEGRPLGDGEELGPTPVAPRALPPGSYLLVLAPPGGAPEVRLPVRADAGATLALDVPLPARVPPGFVHVPAGRSPFGFGGDEDVRRGFFGTAPQHDVDVPAFHVARNEVTLGEWLAYLRALPPAERTRRLPAARTYRNALELHERPDGRFELVLQPTTRRYQALEGEPLRYADRPVRAVVDWRQLPVSAVSFEDAQAYARWLSDTGQVPGARLCDEREWERAARGADGRAFPGGPTLGPDDANIDVTYGRRPGAFGPDPVGAHPTGRSPVGADDMAGNVWELVRSVLEPGRPVLRGGSWYQGELTARSVNREVTEPTNRDPLVGLRLCATP